MKKTDNSHIAEKVQLRLQSLSLIEKIEINILEAYAGDGIIWNEVQKCTDKKLNILKIERKDDKEGVYLKGNNEKFIPLFDLSNFDIIDLDDYGVPYRQLKIIFQKKFEGIVHVTFIQTGMGRLPYKFLIELGYSKQMIQKCQTIFSHNGIEKMKGWLSNNGVKKITGHFIDRKNYFYFQC